MNLKIHLHLRPLKRARSMISKKEVQHIAKLARLGLSPKEEKKFQRELSSILGYVEKLKKVNVAGIEPTSHPLEVVNVMRQDEAKSKKQRLLTLAPETKAGYIKVKQILGR